MLTVSTASTTFLGVEQHDAQLLALEAAHLQHQPVGELRDVVEHEAATFTDGMTTTASAAGDGGQQTLLWDGRVVEKDSFWKIRTTERWDPPT